MYSCISTILKLVKVIISDPVKNHLKIYFWIFNSDVSFLILIAFFNGLTRNFSNFTMYLTRISQHCSSQFFSNTQTNRFILLYVRKLQLSFNTKFMTHFLPVSLSFFFFFKKTANQGSGPTVFCICLHFKCNISFIFILKYNLAILQ